MRIDWISVGEGNACIYWTCFGTSCVPSNHVIFYFFLPFFFFFLSTFTLQFSYFLFYLVKSWLHWNQCKHSYYWKLLLVALHKFFGARYMSQCISIKCCLLSMVLWTVKVKMWGKLIHLLNLLRFAFCGRFENPSGGASTTSTGHYSSA